MTKKDRRGNFMIIRRSFTTSKRAKAAIGRNFPDHKILFETILGSLAKEYGFVFNKQLSPGWGHIVTYDYPPETMTQQQKKSFRTKHRRWKRKFNKKLTHAYAAE